MRIDPNYMDNDWVSREAHMTNTEITDAELAIQETITESSVPNLGRWNTA